jgi:two-component system NtrC family sensor kinase
MDVLIVDDDAAVRKAFQRALERSGYMVQAVDNGLAAFAELQQHQYRAIILDIGMPFLKGDNLYGELASTLPDMARRVIFVTGWAGRDDIKKFLEETGRPFLAKPVDFKTLVATVRRVAEGPG